MIYAGRGAAATPTSQPRDSRVILGILIGWLFISSVYYIDNLFTPRFNLNYEEGFYHKAAKYIFCTIISVYVIHHTKNYILGLLCVILGLFAAAPLMTGEALGVSAVSMLIIATMSGWVGLLQAYQGNIALISRTIILSGIVVAAFSAVEVTVLSLLFESYWRSTGGMRSISTLFNPNNMGLYIGTCIILLMFDKMGLARKLCLGCFLAFPFFASGSRTAWLALAGALLLSAIFSPRLRCRVLRLGMGNLAALVTLAVAVCGGVVVYNIMTADVDIESVNRGVDLYTASIRWENFIKFIYEVDLSIILPDIYKVREGLVQDNFYLMMINSLGLIMLSILIMFLALIFDFRKNVSDGVFPWVIILFYYLISGFSGSFLNSFPNNQLFFLSAGAVLVMARGRWARSMRV